MTGVINTGTVAKALWPGVNKFYGMGYNEEAIEFTKVFDKDTSDKSYEEDVSISGFGYLKKKAQGAAIEYDSIRQGYTTRYTHATYALGFMITQEMIEDEQYNLAFKQARALGYSVRQTREVLAWNVLNRAFNSSYTGGDSKELCATDHPNVAGGTWANELAVAADLSEAALEQALIDIGGFTDDRGLQIKVMPKMLILPRQLEFDAARILKTTGRVGTDYNDINAVRTQRNLEMFVSHYLTDADAWFIKTDVPDGLKYFERVAPKFAEDNDFDTENAKFKARFRESYGFTDPRGIFGSPGA